VKVINYVAHPYFIKFNCIPLSFLCSTHAEIYHIVSQSSATNENPMAPELTGEQKTIKPSQDDEKPAGKKKCCASSQ